MQKDTPSPEPPNQGTHTHKLTGIISFPTLGNLGPGSTSAYQQLRELRLGEIGDRQVEWPVPATSAPIIR